MRGNRRIWFELLLTVLLTGCGLALQYRPEDVELVTPGVVEVSCEATDKKGRKWTLEKTPATLTVSVGAAPLSVICQKRGYKPALVMVESMGFWQRNDHHPLGGATLGEFSGTQRYYPAVVEIHMQPSLWKTEAERKTWLEKKARARLLEAQRLVHPELDGHDPEEQPPADDQEGLAIEEEWVRWMKRP